MLLSFIIANLSQNHYSFIYFMNHETAHLDLASQMFAFAALHDHNLAPKGHEDKIYFINHNGVAQYELWEAMGFWNVSTLDGYLLKKHEDFYFALKHLILHIEGDEMDTHFGKKEDE